ncbi:MAG: hypothetical protein M1823_005223 [Watsoniomyces obsoletus]|nr:MAG: hypothetical protein M1823_005223 [Watsoniomyces obsoletus]
MFYDLDIPWTTDILQLQKTLAFSHESIRSPTSPIPTPLPFRVPPGLRILKRCTVILSDPSENHRLASLSNHYDLIAARPSTERAFQQVCQTLEVGLISLDMTARYPFHFKRSLVRAAIARGIRFEIAYAPGIVSSDPAARRNLIGNATQLIRATKGKGIVISSGARSAAGLRGPIDLVNLMAVWGLGSEKGREAVEGEARKVVVMADMKRTSWRRVIDVIDGGDPPPPLSKSKAKSTGDQAPKEGTTDGKRKAEAPLSKRQAKKARKEQAAAAATATATATANEVPETAAGAQLPKDMEMTERVVSSNNNENQNT